MMEWHLGKNASISVVKERHACVHALSASISVSVSVFITPYRKHGNGSGNGKSLSSDSTCIIHKVHKCRKCYYVFQSVLAPKKSTFVSVFQEYIGSALSRKCNVAQGCVTVTVYGV